MGLFRGIFFAPSSMRHAIPLHGVVPQDLRTPTTAWGAERLRPALVSRASRSITCSSRRAVHLARNPRVPHAAARPARVKRIRSRASYRGSALRADDGRMNERRASHFCLAVPPNCERFGNSQCKTCNRWRQPPAFCCRVCVGTVSTSGSTSLAAAPGTGRRGAYGFVGR